MTRAWNESTQTWERVEASARALHTHEQGLGAGERNVDSLSNGYGVVREEANGTYLEDGTTTEQTVSAVPSHLHGILIQGSLTGTVTVTDGVANRFVIPTTSTGLVDFMKMRFEMDLRITLSNAGDDILVFWRPI